MEDVEIINGHNDMKFTNYMEIKMMNGDVFKTRNGPNQWRHITVRDKDQRLTLDVIVITELRAGGDVWLNTDHISSIRYIGDTDPIADEQYEKLRQDTEKLTADTLGATLGAILGGGPKQVE